MLLMTFLGLIFKFPILKAFGASDTTIPYAMDYMTVITSACSKGYGASS